MRDIKNNIEFLRRKLRYWEYLYYVKDDSNVSDEEYDRYMGELRNLEYRYPNLVTVDSPTQRVGSKLRRHFRFLKHTVPMLSLDSVFDELSLLNFDKRIRNKLGYRKNGVVSYCCELKIDGLGVSLVYENGILMRGSTRGDGFIGEDVTENLRTIRSIPLSLRKDEIFPRLLEVRGEVFMSNDCFLKLNQSLTERGIKVFSNPRNAASGSLLQINSSVTSKRSLDFFCYNIAYFTLSNNMERLPDSHCEQLKQCNRWGIPIIREYTNVCTGIEEVLEYFKKIQKIRSMLKFNIDGVVIKVDSILLQKKLGSSLRSPKWAISYKFPAKKVISRVLDIRFQISRMGILTPIALVVPTLISGILVRNVNLHNIDIIHRLGLMIGDSVIIRRSGDVIPQIIEVVLSDRAFNKVLPVVYPKHCLVCGSILYQVSFKKTFLRCSGGWNCLAQRRGVLKHFSSRRAMNIVGMGDKIIDRLIKLDLLHTPVDFFQLNMESLLCVDGIKEKLAGHLLNAIEIAKQTTLSRFIYALGIPNVGEVTSIVLSKSYGDIDVLINADIASLLSVKDIGDIVAHSIFNFFRNNDHLCIVKELVSSRIGIQFK